MELWFFFDLLMNKRLSKQSRHRWIETPSRSLWRYRNDIGTAPFPYNITPACWIDCRKHIPCLSCIANTMDANGLATQGARTSVAMILARISRNIPFSSTGCFMYLESMWGPSLMAIVGMCMMTSSNGNISALLAICAGNSPHKGQWRGALMFSLICAWINSWVNNRESGDLRRNRVHYEIIAMVGRWV